MIATEVSMGAIKGSRSAPIFCYWQPSKSLCLLIPNNRTQKLEDHEGFLIIPGGT